MTKQQNAPMNERALRFVRALRDKDLGVMRSLAEEGDLGSIPDSLSKALSLAAGMCNEPTVAALLQAGANPNWLDPRNGYPALHWVTVQTQMGIMKMLLDAGANPDGAGSGREPLWIAIGNGSLPVVELLLAAGASTDITLEDGTNLLHYAVLLGFPALVQRFRAAGLSVHDVDPTGKTAMHYAAHNAAGATCIELLSSLGVSVEGRCHAGMTPLLTAAEKGNMHSFEQLTAKGADPLARNNAGQGVLELALVKRLNSLSMDSDKIALWMLERYPDLAPTGEVLDKAFVQAVRGGKTDLVRKLADLGADVGQKPEGRTLLQYAPRENDELKRVLRALKTSAAIGSAMKNNREATSPAPASDSPIL